MSIMDDKTQRYSYWGGLVEEQEKSGLSRAEFCRRRGLAISQFYYYRSVLKIPDPVISQDNTHFKLIQLKEEKEPLADEIKIVLPNGFQCIVPSKVPSQQIKQLMEVLLSC